MWHQMGTDIRTAAPAATDVATIAIRNRATGCLVHDDD